jgi:hypothetical protein
MRNLLVVLVLSACSSSAKAPATNTPSPSPAGETACSADADCVVVEMACCDHCNGGRVEAYNAAFAAAHKPAGCEGTACTKMACGAATASCDAGTCKVTIGPVM